MKLWNKICNFFLPDEPQLRAACVDDWKWTWAIAGIVLVAVLIGMLTAPHTH